MISKSSSSFFSALFVACLLGCTVATPVLESVKSESSNDISGFIEQTVKSIPKNLEWMQHSLQQLASNVLRETAVDVLGWIFGFCIRIEMVMMADESRPSHYVFPIQDSDTEKEHRAMAMTAIEMWMDVTMMEEMNSILVNVSENVIGEMMKNTQTTMSHEARTGPAIYEPTADPTEAFTIKIMQIMFEQMEKTIMANAHLSSEFKTKKIEAEKQVLTAPEISGPLVKLGKEVPIIGEKEMENVIFGRPLMLQAILNKLFINQGSKHLEMIFSQNEFDQYVEARAVMELANKQGKKEAINRLYHEALEKIAKTMTAKTDDSDLMKDLFSALETKFEKDPTLNAQFNVMKEKLNKTTVFDGDMFQIRILPL